MTIEHQDNYILTRTEGRVGRIILNRPKALNALDMDMCAEMNKALLAWAGDEAIDRVLITASEGRAFCAGGDVRAIIPLIKEDPAMADAYFKVEYTLDSLISAFPKPIITIADGLTMGGGSGVLLNSSHPVITEKMDFAMPETAIGLFPDVGASVFLRKLPNRIGVMMGMTGWRIGAGDMLKMGLAPRATPSDTVEEMCESIIAIENNTALAPLLENFKIDEQPTPTLDSADWIENHFSQPTPQAIRDSLEGDTHPMAEQIRQALDTRSPYSITVTHRLLTDAQVAPKDPIEALKLDYVLACRIARYPDFVEGVRAVLIDKDNAPKWQHNRLDEVESSLIDSVFAKEDRPDLGAPEAALR